MAQAADLRKMLTIVWKTEKPFQDRSRISSDFSLMGQTWYLKMVSHDKSFDPNVRRFVYYYKIYLVRKENKPLQKPFHITTYIETKERGNFFPTQGCKSWITAPFQTIWSFEMTSASEAIPGFKDFAFLYVVCLFPGFAPSMSCILNKTEHLSTQTEMNLPSTILLDSIHSCEGITPSTRLQESSCKLENLSEDISKLFDQNSFVDLKLECEGRSFSAHKAILAARSEIFADKLRTELAEDETTTIAISDLDSEVLELLLKFAYSGKVSGLTAESAPRLYVAGLRYAVRGLQKECSQWMARNISVEHCISFLTFANEHRDDAFKNAVISFIISHPQVLKTEDWYRFSETPSKLAIEVYERFVTKVTDQSNHND